MSRHRADVEPVAYLDTDELCSDRLAVVVRFARSEAWELVMALKGDEPIGPASEKLRQRLAMQLADFLTTTKHMTETGAH